MNPCPPTPIITIAKLSFDRDPASDHSNHNFFSPLSFTGCELNDHCREGEDQGSVRKLTDGKAECRLCKKHFQHVSTANRHVKEVHMGRAREQPVKCPSCQKAFSRVAIMEVHYGKVHQGSHEDPLGSEEKDWTKSISV